MYPKPKLENIKKIYDFNYFQNNNSNSTGYENYLKDKPNIIKTFKKRFKKIENLLVKNEKSLDLGCACGFFLEIARDKGFDAHGIEISDWASKIAKKKFGAEKIFNGTLQQSDFPEAVFDLITMWDYIEHILDPMTELLIIHKLLNKDGMLVLTTPNTNSWAHKVFKQKWMGYKDKEHLQYFSDKNLNILLQKTGFKVIKKEKVGKFITLSVFAQRLGLYSKPLSNTLNFFIEKMGLRNFYFYVNSGDIICIYAKKNENYIPNSTGV
jgi:2-polyprenyl-3-methyl-5-hydroxy-6-metoxy-1,4-benzoquinol methylase